MSKKLMLLAVGVLTALAMTALPSAASAGEFVATCSGGAANCTGNVESTGIATLEEDNGLAIECLTNTGVTTGATTGTVTYNNNSSTGSTRLLFHNCRDETFKTHCESTGQPNGTITTNNMITHLVYIDPNKATPGVLVTGTSVTFRCPVINLNKRVTGNIIGHIENPNCGVAKTNHTVEFKAGAATGSQAWTQVTTTGTVFDLTVASSTGVNEEVGDTTASQAGTAHINYPAGQTVTLDC